MIHCSRGTARVVVCPSGGLAGAALAIGERAGIARVVQGAQHPPVRQRHSTPARLCAAPVRIRAGNSSPSRLNACTTARADPVRAKVSNR